MHVQTVSSVQCLNAYSVFSPITPTVYSGGTQEQHYFLCHLMGTKVAKVFPRTGSVPQHAAAATTLLIRLLCRVKRQWRPSWSVALLSVARIRKSLPFQYAIGQQGSRQLDIWHSEDRGNLTHTWPSYWQLSQPHMHSCYCLPTYLHSFSRTRLHVLNTYVFFTLFAFCSSRKMTLVKRIIQRLRNSFCHDVSFILYVDL